MKKRERVSQKRQHLLPFCLTPSAPRPHLQGDHNGVGMGLQVSATLAALGPHEILKLGDLFVEAVDVLVKEPKEKQYQPWSPPPVSLPPGYLWQGGQSGSY